MSKQKLSSGISAVVLAAGMSRRMGVPKQLLPMDGKTILEKTLENVYGSEVDEVILVLGFSADDVEKKISTQGGMAQNIKIVRNHGYQEGMGTSLRTGLAAVGTNANAALIVLADQPFVRAATLNALMECHRLSKPQIVIPMYRGFRGNPVLLDRSVFEELKELDGDVGCRAIFGKHTENILKLPVDDAGILLDIDSRDDYEKLCSVDGNEQTGVLLESREDLPAGQPELVLVGRDAVVQALAKFGRLLKFTVTIVDPFLPLELSDADCILRVLDFSQLPKANGNGRYVVVASRGQCDEEALEQALRADVAYVALLANKKRAQEIGRNLQVQTKSITPEKIASIRAPAGLEIGADTPEEIALSIMAEIVVERRRGIHQEQGK